MPPLDNGLLGPVSGSGSVGMAGICVPSTLVGGTTGGFFPGSFSCAGTDCPASQMDPPRIEAEMPIRFPRRRILLVMGILPANVERGIATYRGRHPSLVWAIALIGLTRKKVGATTDKTG